MSAIPVERRDEFWRIRMFRGIIRWPMYNYPANHGDMWTIVVEVVNASHQIVRVLMFMACPS